MCGRYLFIYKDNNLGKQIKKKAQELQLVDYKLGEVFPSDRALVLLAFKDKLKLETKKWGIKYKSLIINARIEGLDNTYLFKDIKNKRLAIISSGFYEWCDKKKYHIDIEGDYMFLAGIYKDDEFVILTKEADDSMNNIHDRMPIIMNKEEMFRYLNGENIFDNKHELMVTYEG